MRVTLKESPAFQPVVLRIDATMQERYQSDDPEREEQYQTKLNECRRLTGWFERDAKRLRDDRLATIEADCIELEKLGKAKQEEIAEHENHGGDWMQSFNAASKRGAEAKGMCDSLGENPPNRASSTAKERQTIKPRLITGRGRWSKPTRI